MSKKGMTLGQAIKKVRKEVGMSCREFAGCFGISKTTINNIENEKVNDVSLDTLERLFDSTYTFFN